VSYTIDVNILLYGTDRASPFHQAASAFLRDRPRDPDILCLTWPVLMGYVRLATHPRVFDVPVSPAEAVDNVAALTRLPRCRVVTETEDFLTVYRQIAVELSARGNLVPDAHLATLARVHGVRTIYTHDRDFRKFGFLNVVDPIV